MKNRNKPVSKCMFGAAQLRFMPWFLQIKACFLPFTVGFLQIQP